jgi:hypothetical protein
VRTCCCAGAGREGRVFVAARIFQIGTAHITILLADNMERQQVRVVQQCGVRQCGVQQQVQVVRQCGDIITVMHTSHIFRVVQNRIYTPYIADNPCSEDRMYGVYIRF